MEQGVCVYDADNRIVLVNQRYLIAVRHVGRHRAGGHELPRGARATARRAAIFPGSSSTRCIRRGSRRSQAAQPFRTEQTARERPRHGARAEAASRRRLDDDLRRCQPPRPARSRTARADRAQPARAQPTCRTGCACSAPTSGFIVLDNERYLDIYGLRSRRDPAGRHSPRAAWRTGSRAATSRLCRLTTSPREEAQGGRSGGQKRPPRRCCSTSRPVRAGRGDLAVRRRTAAGYRRTRMLPSSDATSRRCAKQEHLARCRAGAHGVRRARSPTRTGASSSATACFLWTLTWPQSPNVCSARTLSSI